VLGDVPREKRCQCREQPAEKKRSWFDAMFRK
jgi:hypothetical protein